MGRPTLLPLLLAPALAAGGLLPAQELAPAAPVALTHSRSLFIVVIDGLRSTEAFDDPARRFIPRMWQELRPRGALYRNFWNLAQTNTTPAHTSLLTGAWELAPNLETNHVLRPLNPTLFEYYRRAHPSLPAEQTWAVVGKGNCRLLDHSLHPAFGPAWKGNLAYPAEADDQATWARVKAVIAAHHPALMLVNLGEVDAAGHAGVWARYTAAIRQADGIVADLWRLLESDPFYRGATTLMVTTDHGRHDDDHGGFLDHGGICAGCRRLFLLALGPDILPGQELAQDRELIDIAPTAGEILRIPTPLAEGEVLTEMLIPWLDGPGGAPALAGPARLTQAPGRSEHPAVAAGAEGTHLVWTDRRNGGREVFAKLYDPATQAWTADRRLSGPGRQARSPALATDGLETQAAWLELEDGLWSLHHRRRVGGAWAPPTLLAASLVETPPWLIPCEPWEPAAAAGQGQAAVAAPVEPHWVLCLGSAAGLPPWAASTVVQGSVSAHGLALAAAGTRLCAAWAEASGSQWAVHFAAGTAAGWSAPLPPAAAANHALHPALAFQGNEAHLAWAELKAGGWHVLASRTADQGRSWTPAQLLAGPAAWRPALGATPSRLVLAWEDHRQGESEIYLRISADGGRSWSAETRVTQAAGWSVFPRLAPDGSALVWQDDRDGEWEIYGLVPLP